MTCEADVAPGTKEPAPRRGWTPIAAFLRGIAIASLAGSARSLRNRSRQTSSSSWPMTWLGDLGCYGGTKIRTPALDRIASGVSD